NAATNSLDGGLPVYRHVSRKNTRLLFPIVFATETEFSLIQLANPTFSPATVTLQLYKFTGDLIGGQPRTGTISGRSKLSTSIGELFTSGLEKLLFSVGLEFADELDRSEVSGALLEEFRGHGSALTPPIRVEVQQAGSRWKVSDANTYFYIRNEDQ